MIPALDWFWLYLQIVILAAIPARQILKPKNRNLFAILIPITMLVLVQGQTLWMFGQFEQRGVTDLQHLYQNISLDGARLANLYIFLSIICLFVTYGYCSLRNKTVRLKTLKLSNISSNPKLRDFVLFALVLVFGWMVISTVGGVEAAITRPGMSMVHGVVMYMIFTSLGKIPSLHNIALDKKNNWLAGSLFLFVTLIFLFNSRFLTVFVLLQMIILFHYCRREISKTILLSSAAICFLIIIVFGLYRDLGSSVNISEVDNIYSALSAHVDQRNIWDWFYGINIEGFTGLAGLLTFEAGRGGISHDLGISNISVIFQFIPSSLRFSETLPFNDMREFFGSMYPGTGSIVSSGMENSYAHFGLLGVIGLGILLGYLMQWLHVQMLNQKTNRLLIALISVHALQLIRGSFYNALFFGLSEVIVLFIFILLQRYFNMAEFAARAVKQRAE